jgi:hypothetical protein
MGLKGYSLSPILEGSSIVKNRIERPLEMFLKKLSRTLEQTM